MKSFEFAAPRTEAELLRLLSPIPGHTEVLAGGTDLVGLMKKMVVTPERVVNLMEVPSMRGITIRPDGAISIGATTALDEVLEHPYLASYSALLDALRGINSMQLQAQGTLGGEICQRPQCWFFRSGQGLLADRAGLVSQGQNEMQAILDNAGPAKFVSGSRTAPAIAVLNAEVRVIGPGEADEQWLPVAALFRTPRKEGERETVLLPNQVVTHIVLPPVGNLGSATYEVRQSEGPDYPLASAAAALRLEGGRVREARVTLGMVAPRPYASQEAKRALLGKSVSEETAVAAGLAAIRDAKPLAHNGYKVQLAKVAVKRAILEAASRAASSQPAVVA